jgi:hypothetical protein
MPGEPQYYTHQDLQAAIDADNGAHSRQELIDYYTQQGYQLK